MAGSEKDAGFCSGGDEDDMSSLHSPSASEDSVEVQVTPISLRNKRKLAEPRRIQEQNSAPLKKRRYEQVVEEILVTDEESRPVRSPSPFRPWSSGGGGSGATGNKQSPEASRKSPARVSSASVSLLASPLASDSSEDKKEEEEEEEDEEEEDVEYRASRGGIEASSSQRTLAADAAGYPEDVSERLRDSQARPDSPRGSPHRSREPRQKLEGPPATPSLPAASPPAAAPPPVLPLVHPRLQDEPLALVLRGELPRVPSHPGVTYDRTLGYPVAPGAPVTHQQPPPPAASKHEDHHHPPHHHHSTAGASSAAARQQGGQQRNYKNMTRERRIEANARERTRVHTISAAFDTLRRAIPAYSHNQKLSKLSVLRIACSYIMTLGKIVNTPEGESANGASLGACVDLVSRTIQTEGKLRKRKED